MENREFALSVGECIDLHAGLKALDGVWVVLKRNGEDIPSLKLYNLGGELRWAISGNIVALKGIVDRYNDARSAMQAAAVNDDGTLKMASMLKIDDELKKLLGNKEKITLTPIQFA